MEQVPDRRIAWAATNAGTVEFEDLGNQTRIRLTMDYESEEFTEHVGDKLNIIENRAEHDLEKFKDFIEDEGYATGAWRGTIHGGRVSTTPADLDQPGTLPRTTTDPMTGGLGA